MSPYVLHTNIVSKALKIASPALVARMARQSPADIYISVVTEAEILFGLAKRGNPKALVEPVETFFRTTTILVWDSEAAAAYARLKCAIQPKGIGIAALDLMIAAQALAAGAVLVTNDTALKQLTPWLSVEDWTEAS